MTFNNETETFRSGGIPEDSSPVTAEIGSFDDLETNSNTTMMNSTMEDCSNVMEEVSMCFHNNYDSVQKQVNILNTVPALIKWTR